MSIMHGFAAPSKSSALTNERWHSVPMTAIRTARDRARAELTAEITKAARGHLAEHGAAALSLRAVARELGMASSAVYRYFASRDELLTALITDAYTSLADAASAAVVRTPRGDHRRRWVTASRAVRRWALAHPHEYALVYGSPVPGYRAPRETVEPAARVLLLFVSIVADAAGVLEPPPSPALPARLDGQLRALRAELAPELAEPVLASVVVAVGQLLGMVSLELFGHLVGSFEPAEPVFEHAVAASADLIGFPG